MALYYMGRTCRELSDEAQARDWFIKVVQAVDDNHYDTTDNHYKSKAYSQLGSIFLFQSLPEDAIKMYRQSYNVNLSMGDTWA